jgi:hypothetical protein
VLTAAVAFFELATTDERLLPRRAQHGQTAVRPSSSCWLAADTVVSWAPFRTNPSTRGQTALTLPFPRLPLKKGESLLAQASGSPGESGNGGVKTRPRQFSVVLSLGRKVKKLSTDLKDKGKRTPPDQGAEDDEEPASAESQSGRREGTLLDGMRLDVEEAGGNPWRDSYQGTPRKAARTDGERALRLRKKLSFDPATVGRPPAAERRPQWTDAGCGCPFADGQGVIMLPHSDEDSDNDFDEDGDEYDGGSNDVRPGPSASGGLTRSETTPLLATPTASTHKPYFPHKRARTASSPAAPPPALRSTKAKGSANADPAAGST